tara:strand:+ start:8215 stop:10050 length:1836 start_codon:yes stop_codon:yes gene_type:complete
MKKYSIYIAILIGGLVLGYLIFGTGSQDKSMKDDEKSAMADEHDHAAENGGSEMWTCSMHPQIMLPEPGDCPICGMDLIPAEEGAGGLSTDQFKMTENALALANIQTTRVGGANVEGNSLVLSGKIMENTEKTAVLPAHFNGRIEKLYVNYEGEKVRKGQAVASVYSPPLISAQQELITAYGIRESQPAIYQAVRNKFKNWKIHGSQLDEIVRTGNVKTEFKIYSHVSGVVTDINVKEGDHIMDGHPIFKVANLKSVWAMFDAYENQISSLKEGQEIQITTNAYPDKEFTAKVSFIDPVLNTATRTVMIRAVLNNKNDLFKPGMFVQGKVKGTSGADSEAVVVPQSAVLWTGERSVVYVKAKEDEPVFELREVKLGKSMGDQYEILSGLQNGEQVVTNGTFTVDAAAQLKGKKSMMSPEGGMAGGSMPGMDMGNDAQVVKGQVSTEKFLEGRAYDFRKETPEAFRKQLDAVINAYLSLKDGLVEADEKATFKYSTVLYEALQDIDGSVLKGEAKAFWEEKKSFLMQHAKLCKEASTIAGKRENFIYLSQPLIKVVEAYGPGEAKLYVDFCPMANNNKGAFWLSASKTIENPFMDEGMRSCGEVKQEISSNK